MMATTPRPVTLPSVSIVVLNHNYERYVGEALASAVGQEPGAFRLAEIVVIDDGSTDRSRDRYSRFPGVRVVRKAREGFAATLSRAVGEASGDWLAPLDADDAFTTDKLRKLGQHLADPAALLIQHAEYVIDSEGRSYAEGTHPGGSTSTLVVRTEAARDLLPVTNELFFHVLADLGHGIRLPEPLTRYRVHGQSMTDRRTPGVFADYMAGICADVTARLDQLCDQPPPRTYQDRAEWHHADARRQRDEAAVDTAREGWPA
jgi:glycosyltransferase involved in cell wall biosynthesis